EPCLRTLWWDDSLRCVAASGVTPFVLPSLAGLIGVSVPTRLEIFRPPFFWNTVTASIWMTGQFLVYYSMIAMFRLVAAEGPEVRPGDVALTNILHNAIVFFAMGWGGFVGDNVGRGLRASSRPVS